MSLDGPTIKILELKKLHIFDEMHNSNFLVREIL